jgi:hypothetical protein
VPGILLEQSSFQSFCKNAAPDRSGSEAVIQQLARAYCLVAILPQQPARAYCQGQ